MIDSPRGNGKRSSVAPLAGLVLLLAPLLPAQEPPDPGPSETPTVSVIAGRESYRPSGRRSRWLGKGYRAEWTTPFAAPVVDLGSFAGGLIPVREVGGMQSTALALKGGDGRAYTFRLLDKDATKILPEEWRDTFPAKLFQDQTTANHPASLFIVPPLAIAVGVPWVSVRPAVLPDDPRLGEFRTTFAGEAGALHEFPTPKSERYDGFMGATEIVSSPTLWERWLEGEVRVDIPTFLRARMLDLVVGNWDRHNGNWRFMRVRGQPEWVALPEDADQAFSDFRGWAHPGAGGVPAAAEVGGPV